MIVNEMSQIEEKLRKKLRHRPVSLIEAAECRKAAVCLALLCKENGPEIILQVRSRGLEEQPGDISLPGGMVEPGETPEQAACRELEEELLISGEQYEIISLLDIMHTGNLLIYPFLAVVHNYQGTYNTAEVAEIFTGPLRFFIETEPEIYKIRLEVKEPEDFPFDKIYGGKKYGWRKRTETVYFYDYEKYCIWGITAKLIHSFREICGKEKPVPTEQMAVNGEIEKKCFGIEQQKLLY